MPPLKTPDITPGAIATWAFVLITNAALLFGLSIPGDKKAALMIVLNSIAVLGFFLHDAIIRRSRAQMYAELKKSEGEQGYVNPD